MAQASKNKGAGGLGFHFGMGIGLGLGVAALVIVIALLALGWHMGLFHRLFYAHQVQTTWQQAETQQDTSSEPNAYVFSQLGEDDQAAYLIMLKALQSREALPYPQTNEEQLAFMRDCVLADHPELFAVTGVSAQTSTNQLSGYVTNVQVQGSYSCSAEEAAHLQAKLDTVAHDFLRTLPSSAGDYETAKACFEYLVDHVEYDDSVALAQEDNNRLLGQTAVDALIDGRAVCAGYARGFQFLMQKAGIPCLYVTGVARDQNHAWCAAFLDGSWYFIDPTWGDSQYLAADGTTQELNHMSYDYLCVTDRDLAGTHRIDAVYPVPPCTNNADNYFVREGLLVNSTQIEEAGALIQKAAENGLDNAHFRCANRTIFDAQIDNLFNNRGIYRYIDRSTCTYLPNEDLLTISISF